MISLYQNFTCVASIPGDHELRIDLKGYNSVTLQSTSVGRATVDLEDRWLSLQRRIQRASTNPDYIRDNLSYSGKKKKFWIKYNHQEYGLDDKTRKSREEGLWDYEAK